MGGSTIPQNNSLGAFEILTDVEGQLNGYACTQLDNGTVDEIRATTEPFYFAYKYPIGQSVMASAFINNAIVERVATKYNITSGLACLAEEPLTSDHSWLVSIQSSIAPLDMLGSCHIDDSFDPELQDCYIAQLNVTGMVVGQHVMPDVVEYVEDLLQGEELAERTPYIIEYFGGSDLEAHIFGDTQSSPYDNLAPAKGNDDKSGPIPLTGLGIAVISLLAFTLVALIFAVVRRKRQKKGRIDDQLP